MQHSNKAFSSKRFVQQLSVVVIVWYGVIFPISSKLCCVVAWVSPVGIVVPSYSPSTFRIRHRRYMMIHWNQRPTCHFIVDRPSSQIPQRKQQSQTRRPMQQLPHEENTICETDVSSKPHKNDNAILLDSLLVWFQGDFDNYRQVVTDRQAGLLPREYGGHEHIHCSLIPVTYTSRLAAFYFDGTPDAIFRFRFYQLQPSDDGTTVDTILYTLSKELETKLRACTDVMQWSHIFQHHVTDQVCGTTGMAFPTGTDFVEWAIRSSSVTILPNCEVRWSRERDAIQHSYVDEFDSHIRTDMISSGLHAIMVHNEALVDSQMIPGQKILIKDQLSLWDDQLWIHDRGYNPETMAYIYGNQNGIPYRMQRVTDMVAYRWTEEPSPPQRRITDTELAWTLGNDYRTQVEYEANMQVIGGSSRRI